MPELGSDRRDRPLVPPVSDKGSGTPSGPSSAAEIYAALRRAGVGCPSLWRAIEKAKEEFVSNHDLLLPFDTDSAEFIAGFECGHVWTKLRETDERSFTVHASNAEMMLRIAEAIDGSVQSVDLDESWIEVVFDV